MQLTEMNYSGPLPIDSYGPGFFRFGGAIHKGALGLLPTGQVDWHGLTDMQVFLKAKKDIDVVLMGMGPEIAMVPEAVRLAFEAADIGLELMSTPSACRTYNILLSEGRRIGAALLTV